MQKFEDIMQEYLDASDPDLNIPLSKIFKWFFDKGKTSAATEICALLTEWGRQECITRGVDPDTPVFNGDYNYVEWKGINKLAFSEMTVVGIKEKFGVEI